MIQGQRSMPVLAVSDVEKTAEFFVDGLGFKLAGKWLDDDDVPSFAIVIMGKITVGMQRANVRLCEGRPWAAYFYVSDIEAYAAQITGNGIRLTREIMDRFYGCRDLEIEDPDGNILCFGQDLSPGDAGPGL